MRPRPSPFPQSSTNGGKPIPLSLRACRPASGKSSRAGFSEVTRPWAFARARPDRIICSRVGATFERGRLPARERMRVREIALRVLRMPLVEPFETSMERTTERLILLVEADVDGVIGWGECVAGETPSYSPETTETAWHILRDFLWPLIRGREFASAGDAWELLGKVRGHPMAKGALEAAVWDAEAKLKGIPLWKLLGGTREEISSGVSIGIKDSLDELVAAVRKELAAGYQRINIKLGRVGGYTPARRIHDLCQANAIPVWCGGMLESGIGRAHNIALSSLQNFSLPGDVAASRRYWHEDIIDPEVTVSPQGSIHVPSGAGIGFEPRRGRIDSLTVRKERLT